MTEKYSINTFEMQNYQRQIIILIFHISDIVAIPKNLKQDQNSVLIGASLTHNEIGLTDWRKKLLKMRGKEKVVPSFFS